MRDIQDIQYVRTTPSKLKVAIIGNMPPQRCGIAEFTADLAEALGGVGAVDQRVFRLVDDGPQGAIARAEIRRGVLDDYLAAAAHIDRESYDAICIQHEFGIFGGAAGNHLTALIDAARTPIVVTLHTVLKAPNEDQRRVFGRIAARARKLIVMAEIGKDLLRSVYAVPESKIAVVPHGVPDAPAPTECEAKARLGLAGAQVLMTFGLLSPNKGIEHMICAMPAIVARHPNARYAVVGATHPHLVATHGEAYRESLIALAHESGVGDRVCFLNEFVDRERLFELLAAADVYVTPYLNEEQITSGTLAYAVGMGKAVVSTPYWHAKEALSEGRGVLTPFARPDALANAVIALLDDEPARAAMRERARAFGRATSWREIAKIYAGLIREAADAPAQLPPRRKSVTPNPVFDGVARFSDECGIFQHGAFCVPDRMHGYCVDDNARALILACRMHAAGHTAPELSKAARTYASFVNHAWNPQAERFRNFMSYDRRWLEPAGSQDSNGRTFWALGETARFAAEPRLRQWAATLADRALTPLESLDALRARAFVTLGLAHFAIAGRAEHVRTRLRRAAVAIQTMFTGEWFEPVLSYDNARLPEALLRAGAALDDRTMIAAGLRALDWLCGVQTSPGGWFRPIGSESLGLPAEERRPYDQQPLEAAATIDACAAAYDVSGDARWISEAERAFAWFHGENDHGVSLVGADGLCFDGLTPNGPNLNSGAESILALQMSAAALAGLHRAAAESPERQHRLRTAAR